VAVDGVEPIPREEPSLLTEQQAGKYTYGIRAEGKKLLLSR